MNRSSLHVVANSASPAERSRLGAARAKADAFAALEAALVCAELARVSLFEVEKLELLPAGLRDRARRLAIHMSAEVNSTAAMAKRLECGA